MPFSPGTRIGQYEVRAQLGAGGMGEVYRAHDARLGRDVALKVLHPEVARDAVRLERFTREARAVAALNHPHIVTIYSTEESDGIRFMTMELVEGRTLDELIPRDGLPVARFLELAMPLAEALTAAHQKQITHRDLKPGNVMVGADGRVKVLDFGLARLDAAVGQQTIDATRAVLTHEGTIVGTMPYMSPEQVEGRGLDARSDLFSLGVMFYEMLTGSRPFAGPSSAALMSAILRDDPPPVTDRRADVPDALARLVARCLEKHPEERVQTARDVCNELRHVQKQLESGPTRRSGSGSAPSAEASLWIAVLPFAARSSDESTAALAAGLTEDITSGLSRFPALSVIAPQSAAAFRDSQLDVRQIAERLGARYVIGGTVRRSATAVRIAVHLIDAASGAHLWTETYNERVEGTDLFAIQDDVTDRIVATVADRAGVLARSMVQAVRNLSLDQLSARELIFRCWRFQWQPNAAEYAEGRTAIERYLERHPDTPHLLAELANLYVGEHGLFFNPLPNPLERAIRVARRAVELDPGNQEGWKMIAIAAFHRHDEGLMREAGERAIRLNPRNSNVLAWIATVRMHAGDHDAGGELITRARAINPAHPGWYHFPTFSRHFARAEYDDALQAARRANMPEFMWMHFAIAAAAGQLGLGEARSAADAMFRLAPLLADEAHLREFVTRWYWEPDLIERLLEGVRLASGAPSSVAATPSRQSVAESAGRAPERPLSGPGSSGQPSTHTTMRLAVLPFTARGGDDADALAEGLTDDLTTALARFPYLEVVSRAAAPTRNARFLLEGTVRQAGTTVRASVRLSDVKSSAHLWAETFDRDVAPGVFAVQDDLVSRIAATVGDGGGVLVRTMASAVRGRPIEDLDTGELAMRYQSDFVEHFSPADHAALRQAFEAVVMREPASAMAWASLAMLYALEVFFDLNPKPNPLARLREAAERANTLDPTIQQGWVAMATAALFERDRAALQAATDHAVALNPFHTRSLGTLGLFTVFSGDTTRGMQLMERSIALNPRHPGWYLVAPFLDAYQRSDFMAALGYAKRIGMPKFVAGHLAAAAAAGQVGTSEDAKPALDALTRFDPRLIRPEGAREVWARWIWDEGTIDRLVEGLEKAVALAQ